MEVVLFIIVGLLLTVLFASPSWLMWLLAARFFPSNYSMPPNKMTIACVLLSFLTGASLNLELEGGIVSGLVAILVFSILWSILLIPLCVLLKYLGARKYAKSP